MSLDADGDGTEDVLVLAARPEGSEAVLLSGRSGQTLATHPHGNSAGTPIIDDLDGNGHPDIFLFDLDDARQQIVPVSIFWNLNCRSR